jgi:hypothetical protein
MLTIDKVTVNDLVQNKDYEILTIAVTNEDMELIPFGRYFKKDILEIANSDKGDSILIDLINENYGDKHKVLFIQSTRPLKEEVGLYHLTEGMVDFNTAMDCGFGIIRMLEGEYKGEFFLYNSENDENDLSLMLDIYLQLVVKGYENKSLKEMLNQKFNKELITALQSTDKANLYGRLLAKFSDKPIH